MDWQFQSKSTLAGSDETEVMNPKVQTEAVEIRDQHVQADTTGILIHVCFAAHDTFITCMHTN